ncbi:MAG: DUF853 domain-containing protein, partial [Oscillospiraceae bacterium]
TQIVDRDSAYENLEKRTLQQQQAEAEAEKEGEEEKARYSGRRRQSPVSKAAGAMLTTFSREVGKNLFRGLMGLMRK